MTTTFVIRCLPFSTSERSVDIETQPVSVLNAIQCLTCFQSHVRLGEGHIRHSDGMSLFIAYKSYVSDETARFKEVLDFVVPVVPRVQVLDEDLGEGISDVAVVGFGENPTTVHSVRDSTSLVVSHCGGLCRFHLFLV